MGTGDEFELKPEQNRIMLVGLYGQGKTTTTGKLANYFKTRSKKVAVMSTDTWRPAAYEQLKQISQKLEVDVFGNPEANKPEDIWNEFSDKLSKYDVVIVDSAGRDHLNDELVEEITNLNNVVKPTDTFLVMGADVGQTAQKQAEAFKNNLNISGVVITKMDGTGRGGAALSACSTAEAPVRFIGVGERQEDLERFNSEKFVSQLLGMGDIETLLEKAKLTMNEEKARSMADRMMRGDFDLDDLYEQMKSMKKMGSMTKILGMIPGLGGLNIDKNMLGGQEEKMKKWKYIMDSMTKFEKRNPDKIDLSRIKRVAGGSGSNVDEVRGLLKHFKQTKKMMNMFKDPSNMPDMENMEQGDIMQMMKKMGGMKGMKKFMKKNKKN
jgi:signal recognition particle subunit SRP54